MSDQGSIVAVEVQLPGRADYDVVLGRIIGDLFYCFFVITQKDDFSFPDQIPLEKVKILNTLVNEDGSLGKFGKRVLDYLKGDKVVRVQPGTETAVHNLHGVTFHNIFCQVTTQLHTTVILLRFFEQRFQSDDFPSVTIIWDDSSQNWLVSPVEIKNCKGLTVKSLDLALKHATIMLKSHPLYRSRKHISWIVPPCSPLMIDHDQTLNHFRHPSKLLKRAIEAYLFYTYKSQQSL
jgi:hypothetical protein